MTPLAYLEALETVGISNRLPAREIDRQVAALLKCDERTARRWRLGEIAIPGPVEVALHALAK